MKQVFEKIKQRITIAATEACGYAALTRVVSEAEVKEILDSVVAEYNNGWIPCSERLPEVPEGTDDDEMSDEDLAEYFSELIKDTYENEYCKDVNDWLNWLQSEVEEVNNPDHAKRPTSMERKYAEDIYREKAMTVAIQSMEKLQEYEKLGTLEEVRKAVKKQIPKKVTSASNGDKLRFGTCPSCNKRISNVEGGNYCQNCGNAIDWR